MAFSSARRGRRPRLATSAMWRKPGDRPPEIEDFVRLRVALAELKIDQRLLRMLTLVAQGKRPVGDLDTHRRRLERGLRRLGLVAETALRKRVSAALSVPTYSAGKGAARRSYYVHEKKLAPMSE